MARQWPLPDCKNPRAAAAGGRRARRARPGFFRRAENRRPRPDPGPPLRARRCRCRRPVGSRCCCPPGNGTAAPPRSSAAQPAETPVPRLPSPVPSPKSSPLFLLLPTAVSVWPRPRGGGEERASRSRAGRLFLTPILFYK